MKKTNLLAIAILVILGVSACSEPNTSKQPKTSSGYVDEKEYTPTVSDEGEYHTIDGDAKQLQFQGSKEQKDQLEMIDEYMREHPGA